MTNTSFHRTLEFNDYPKNTLLAKQRDEEVKENMKKIDKSNNRESLELLKQLIKTRLK